MLPTLLYASETWTVYQRHAKRLNHSRTSCLKKTSKDPVARQDSRLRSPEKGRDAECTYSSEIGTVKMDRPCHVTRMPDERLPKKILYGELQVGKRSHGGQKKDTLKASLKDFIIPTESWEQIAQDRTKRRGLIRRGAGEYEAKRISEAEQKRAQRKVRAKASPTERSSSDLSCSICNRQFRAKFGLISHLRTHN